MMIFERKATLEQLRGVCAKRTLFALLDACDEPTVPIKCSNMTEARAVSLYQGKAQEEYGHMAPYLAQIGSTDLDWILSDLSSTPWGYFVVAQSSLSILRHHFRRFLKATLPDGREVLFRFYDPRVLRMFLESCDVREHQDFFGPVTAFGVQAGQDRQTFSIWMKA